ncbi:hypothetical protein H9Y05_08810 [Crocinitomicaceae bacterium CZZ-1]|uniref:Uncharacterized protein n=1 Tax=Taishania pollutisoli TaxID=2766479 RepID=A0A8J6PCE0_9FLAO|nr:hypothetical protein [Taishania pollutisoli]MBC9812568.1 hypothetical protein [Taishania pollutisoli]
MHLHKKNILSKKIAILFYLVVGLNLNVVAQATYVIIENNSAPNGTTLHTIVNCDGTVDLRFFCSRLVKNITFHYSTPDVNGSYNSGNQFHGVVSTPNITSNGGGLQHHINFNEVNQNAWIKVTFEYKNVFNNWVTVNPPMTQFYSRPTAANNFNSIDYTANSVLPNYYNFIYTGDYVTNNDYYVFNFDDGSAGIWSQTELENGDRLGENDPLYVNASPHFYCRSDEPEFNDLTATTDLQVTKMYTLSHAASMGFGNGANKLLCPYTKPVPITLNNLCDYLTPPTISPGPTEFRPVVQTGNLTNSSLAPFVTSHKINYNWQTGQSGNSAVQFDQNYTANYGNTHGNKTIKEFVTFQGGCVCETEVIYNTNNPCMNMSGLSFSVVYEEGENHFEFTPAHYEGSASQGTPSVEINFGDGSPSVFPTTLDPIAHDFPGNGPYTVTQITTFPGFPPCTTSVTMTQDIILNNEYCCENFSLDNATTAYWISAWVMEGHAIQPKTYQNSYIEIEFLGGGTTVQPYQFHPTGDIIEGWQRIVGKFSIPTGAVKMNIHLASSGGSVDSYFDDVRVHPFNASMKSYVYDAETFWLTAELDDNNYATIYEYDNEGQLIRIKKETARGIMTIQESRSSNVIKYQE